MRTIMEEKRNIKVKLEQVIEKYNTLLNLAVIAKFFNGPWKKTASNTGYFLANTCNGVVIHQHNTVQYAGIVYFKNQEDAVKAIMILGDRVKNLFD